MNILAIGNSFSQDATHFLHQILTSGGIANAVVNLYIGGCSLKRHWDNALSEAPDYLYELNGHSTGRHISLLDALSEAEWDVITLQQASPDSGINDSYYPYLPQLIKYVRQLAPHARLMLHQTWAYDVDSAHEAFGRYGRDQLTMYRRLCAAYGAAAQRYELELIPCGDAVQALRATPEFDCSHGGRSVCRDGCHMDTIYGRYLLGGVWYQSITGRSIMTSSYIPHSDDLGAPVDRQLIDVIRSVTASLFNK